MAYGRSNDGVIHDVRWPWMVKVMIPISFMPVISIFRKWLEIETRLQRGTYRKWHARYQMVTWPMTSRDPERSKSDLFILRCEYLENGLRLRLGTNCPLIGNGLWRIDWWRHRWRHVTYRVQGRDRNIFKARYFVQNSLGGYMYSLSAF